MLKTIVGKLEKKNDNEVNADVAQLERSNNKCYALVFRYIYIYKIFGKEDWNMPLKNSTMTKMAYQERRGGRMGNWSDLVWIVHGQ